MNTRSRILATTIVLGLPPAAFAVTDTWDGGGADNFVSTNANWLDNSTPASNLVDTDLIFAGTTRLTPNFSDGFSMDSITFSNTAGTFNLTGLPLQLGTTGIIDNDTDTQTLSPLVIVNTATTTINAASGGLHFAGGLVPNGKTITFTGAGGATFTNLNGPGNITKTGPGTFAIAAGATPISANLNVNAGTLQVSTNNATTQHISGTVNVGAGSLVLNEYTTFDGTAQLNRTASGAGASVSIITNRELRFANGSDFNIAGSFTFSGGGRVVMADAGSQINATGGGTILIANNTSLVLGDGAAGSFTGASVFNIGVGSAGLLTVSGAAATLACGNTIWGNAGNATISLFTGTVNLQAVKVAEAASTSTVQMSSGATVNQSAGGLVLGGSTGNATLSLTGAGTNWTQTGNIGVTLTGGVSSELSVASGAVFTTGAAGATINNRGRLRLKNAGTFSTATNLLVTGANAELIVELTGVLGLPAGQTLQLEAGALAQFTGDFVMNGRHLSASGTNSRLVCASNLIVANGSTATFDAGSRLDATGNVTAGTSATTGNVTVNGTGAQLLAPSTTWGSGGTGNLTLTNSAAGTLGTTLIGSAAVADSTGVVQVLTGATATSTNLSIGATTFTGNSGTLTLDGAGSTWTQNAASTLTIGAAVTSNGALNVRNGGVYNTGTGLTNLRKTGTLAIQGGTFNANGDLFIDGGLLTRDAAGTLTFEPGKNVTVQNGGDITITGAFANLAPTGAATIIITGAGSTFTTTGPLVLRDNSDTLVDGGAALATGGATLTLISGTDVIVDGSGSSISAGLSTIGTLGSVSSLTLRNASTGSLGGLRVANSGVDGTTGILTVQSGATLTATSLEVGSSGTVNTGTATISGAGSQLTVTGSGSTTIGAASTSLGTLTVENGGTFTTGTGLTEVLATGGVIINAGGTLRGAADFSGTGAVTIAGAFLPGTVSGVNQTTSVSFALNMTFQPTTGITMELGGLTPGTQHDQLVFSGPGATHVTWGGTLTLLLINGFTLQAGHSFNLFDFDAARSAGSFASMSLPALPGGLAWDTSELSTTGVIRVIPGGLTFAEWAAASGIPGALPTGDHDSDGYDNAAEFALGLFPPQPGTTKPTGGFHAYIEGERLRVLFTRPLDRTGVTLKVQAGNDLLTWTDVATSVNSAPFTGPGFVSENRAHPLTDPGLVEVRDILNATTTPRRQMRVRIEIVP